MRYRYLNTKLASSAHRNISSDGLELASFPREDKGLTHPRLSSSLSQLNAKCRVTCIV